MTQTATFDFLLIMFYFYADILNDHCNRITVIKIFIAGSFFQVFPLSLYSLTSDLLRSVPPPALLSLLNDHSEFLSFLCLLYTLILMKVWKMLFCFRVCVSSIMEIMEVTKQLDSCLNFSVSFKANLCP